MRPDAQKGGARQDELHKFGLPSGAGLIKDSLELNADSVLAYADRVRDFMYVFARCEECGDIGLGRSEAVCALQDFGRRRMGSFWISDEDKGGARGIEEELAPPGWRNEYRKRALARGARHRKRSARNAVQ